jgi:hypothetical protein
LEEQTLSRQERLRQILGGIPDSLEGMDPLLDALQQRWSELESNLKKCRNSLVFLNPKDNAAVGSLGRSFESIERTCRKIEKEIAEFIGSLPPESADAKKEFSPPVVSPHFSYWVRMISQELLKFSQKGVTGFPEIVLQRWGETLSAQQIKSSISERFFYEAVADHWDKTLRQLQRFYQLGAWVRLDSEQVGRHRAAVGQLRQCQEELAASFAALGIRPLSLTFLEPVSEREVPYVLKEEECPLRVYFPLADSSQADKRPVVLDVRTWAYLKENGQLWRDRKARLVISA